MSNEDPTGISHYIKKGSNSEYKDNVLSKKHKILLNCNLVDTDKKSNKSNSSNQNNSLLQRIFSHVDKLAQ
jgi:hypothetical protein